MFIIWPSLNWRNSGDWSSAVSSLIYITPISWLLQALLGSSKWAVESLEMKMKVKEEAWAYIISKCPQWVLFPSGPPFLLVSSCQTGWFGIQRSSPRTAICSAFFLLMQSDTTHHSTLKTDQTPSVWYPSLDYIKIFDKLQTLKWHVTLGLTDCTCLVHFACLSCTLQSLWYNLIFHCMHYGCNLEPGSVRRRIFHQLCYSSGRSLPSELNLC